MQETQLAPDVVEADLYQPVMLGLKSLVGSLMQTLGFAAVTIQNASLPAQALAKLVGLTA